jgi:hypothetical protein
MMRSKIAALLTAAVVVLGAGAVRSDTVVLGNVTLMDFETNTNTLLGYPDGQPPLGWFVRTQATKLNAGWVNPQVPPNPCRSLTMVWNIVLFSKIKPNVKRKLQNNLLRQMAKHECRADIQRDEDADPQPMLTITPTP